MTHDELATHLGITLSQVEWSFALLNIINDLSNISDKEKRVLLDKVCGPSPSENWVITWGKTLESWASINIEDDILYWLITGLNENATHRISEALQDIEQEQIIREEVALKDVECVAPPPLFVPQPQGDLIVQTFSTEHIQWSYHTPRKTWYLSDISQEDALLDSIVNTLDSSRPIGLLRVEQQRPSSTSIKATVVEVGTLKIQLENQSNLTLGSIEHSLNIEIQAPGGFGKPFPLSTKNPRVVQESFQRCGRWSVTLEQINGPVLPMIWNLESEQHQSSCGYGGHGGTIHYTNNSFTQLNSDVEWLDGTSIHQLNTAFPKIVGEQVSSHRSIWLADEQSIDFSEHISSLSATVKPIFEETPRLNHVVENRTFIQGTGHRLSAELFVEMNLKCGQEDVSKRTSMEVTNTVAWNVSGSLEWCGHKLLIQPTGDFDLIWQYQNSTATIRCQTKLPLQSIQKMVPSDHQEYCYRQTLCTVDTEWEITWDEFQKE